MRIILACAGSIEVFKEDYLESTARQDLSKQVFHAYAKFYVSFLSGLLKSPDVANP